MKASLIALAAIVVVGIGAYFAVASRQDNVNNRASQPAATQAAQQPAEQAVAVEEEVAVNEDGSATITETVEQASWDNANNQLNDNVAVAVTNIPAQTNAAANNARQQARAAQAQAQAQAAAAAKQAADEAAAKEAAAKADTM